VTKTDFDTLLLETLASNVHEDWLARNGHVNEPARDPGEEALRAIQRLPYTDKNFTEQEKNKDRIHIVLATETYAAARLFPDDIETRILPT
jgi:hypothetical protein